MTKPAKDYDLTPDQLHCVDALARFTLGRHHLPAVYKHGDGVSINYAGDLSTFDGDELTRLVLIAHEEAVRVSIAASGPGRVRIIAHRRQHGDPAKLRFWQYHPGPAELSAQVYALAKAERSGVIEPAKVKP